ncbi:MAG: exosortase [Burkholderia sp.]|nr:exosortase [Burkholderia sp.]
MSEARSVPLPHDLPDAADAPRLKGAALVAILTVVALLAIYYETTRSMVSIWDRSDTFAHCFLIAPISVWLIWRQRKELTTIDSRPTPWALIVLVGLGFGWLLASLAHVLVFQQYFLVAMIPVAIWSVLGTRMAAAIAFPLAYLFLAVPFGEVFIPTMINFTADFTVNALQLTGIPVFREGTYFTLPSGNWSVVEACSGLRYLIASFTLGTLYAYLTYTSLKRRLAFVALSLIVPIIANGIRAYLIVMTGHLSGMTLAVGADHLVYGWVFFGLVMLLLFWIGSFWREDDKVTATAEANTASVAVHVAPLKATAGVAVATIMIAVAWPTYVSHLDRDIGGAANKKIDVPGIPGKWEASPAQLADWIPQYIGTPVRFQQTYRRGSQSISVYLAEYRNQRPGSQLITSANTLVSDKDLWKSVSEQMRSIDLDAHQLTVRQNRLLSPAKKLVIWRWYRLDREETTSPQIAKIFLAKNKLLGRGDDGAEIIIAAQYEDKPDEALPVLKDFLNDMLPAIRKGLSDEPAL